MIYMADENKRLQKKPKGIFKKKRGGVELTRAEIQEIKEGRKKLKRELRKIGEKSRKEFEITASSLGLYFDKTKARSKLLWFLTAHGFWLLLLAALLLVMAIASFALIAEMKGHFTISMSEDMFSEGFIISETDDFSKPTSHLFATPAADVPCISIIDIPENVDSINGEHNGNYFAYTFYLKNEGNGEADYMWDIRIKTESKVEDAAWVMLFVDGEMTIYAKANEDGSPASLPAADVDTFGYLDPPLYQHAADKTQYEIVDQVDTLTYWRVIPKPFEDDNIVAAGRRDDVKVDEVHKYTVVVWIEGDDPDCTNDLIGERIGFEMHMQMVDEDIEE